jgi:hypothetical protein
MPVCGPGSLPGFVGTVTTVAGRGSPAEGFEIPYLVNSRLHGSPGASSERCVLSEPILEEPAGAGKPS